MLTGCANVFFAAIDPSLPYWALQFPSALIIVVGAGKHTSHIPPDDHSPIHLSLSQTSYSQASILSRPHSHPHDRYSSAHLTAGTLFIAKICLPHEQSVGGAIFQTMTQIGSTFGLSISTIVYNAIVRSKAAKLGVEVTGSTSDSDIPKAALLGGYKGAHWTAFAFGIAGELFLFLFRIKLSITDLFLLFLFCVAGTVMGILFLRGVGIVGHKKTKLRDRTAEEGVDAEGKQIPESEQDARDREHDKAVEETLSSSAVQEKNTA